ncbi:putative isomerase [Parabacteroides sp. PFB2-12]|uniref:MGH1-like glycoside hydrolase domain-containing protein n=1 Tax=unclassified Parabacteroides TaxID=2649774 RepID=UPI0024767716|nr:MULTISPECIES: trehalase family glycosidase [unclassified Parabacteroides]MDH6341733.1 putative isomerase [Parabacteroides sp. PM6-13]MDH6389844.1 putative isomerase [Parabacteroides sp. PFB2-12]
MKRKSIYTCSALLLVCLALASCFQQEQETERIALEYGNLLDIRYTPDGKSRCNGWFTDAGAWYGFTPPKADNWVNGFCGPFHLDMNKRKWISQSMVQVCFEEEDRSAVYRPDTVIYYPGELYLKATSGKGSIEQRLIFIDSSTALLSVKSDRASHFRFFGEALAKEAACTVDKNTCLLTDATGEGIAVSFSPETGLLIDKNGYETLSVRKGEAEVVISFYTDQASQRQALQKASFVLSNPAKYKKNTAERWQGYLTAALREDMPAEFDRVAVKAVMTLIANWKAARGDLYHDGVVPSHGVGYFMGFWGWDSWKHAVALARFAPLLAKDQVRTMFDYQTPEGMIIDCIYSEAIENNERNSKPPLAAWAVDAIYRETGDVQFVKEIYPKLLAYYRWWYQYRDHNQNGICEFGACDGTLEAAAWESGMDNAIRFDDSKMVENSPGAWSLDQESVDLNSFLALEHRLLSKLAIVAGEDFNEPNRTADVHNYFYADDPGFFFDKRLDGTFVMEEGTEACIPLWAELATEEQAASCVQIFTNPIKFATYIPFPTIAADNPKFMPAGYWRGPIWLDQVYFGISGMRKYGYQEEADRFTEQVFTRLKGLTGSGPIHENYDTHDGNTLKAPHFSWSSAHLLMLYWEYGGC